MTVIPHVPSIKTSSYDWYDKKLTFETGRLAQSADGSVLLTFGENSLLFTAVLERKPDINRDFTPLSVDWRESYSAAGKIGGGQFYKREGRPSDDAILYARLTDRALRPLFPKGMVNDVVVSITPLCIDREQDLGAMSIIGSSFAIMLAGIPFNGPVGAVRIGRKDGKFIINPTREEIETGEMNLLVAGPKGLINMIECDAKQVSDEVLEEAFLLGQQEIDKICDLQTEIIKSYAIAPKEIIINQPSQELIEYIQNVYLTEEKVQTLFGEGSPLQELHRQCENEVLQLLSKEIKDDAKPDVTETTVKMAVAAIIKKAMRKRTLEKKIRFDNRDAYTVRPLFCQVGLFPRTHGTGLFRRGETQVLTTVSLGSPGDYQIIDTMEFDEYRQRYIHHYNFPGFSTNEAKPTKAASRREIGHGALAEKAIIHVLPPKETFPYAIRAVSECLGSGGSTSQAAICASTLALMDAGVPITAPVAGIAMGLVTASDEKGNITDYIILTDPAEMEDFFGDMDFKIAGTKEGVTAIQLDTKISGLPFEIIKKTLHQAHEARNEILDFMKQTLAQPRPKLSQYAPKIYVLKINPLKIREIIGKGGETINKILEACENAIKIDFESDGTCYVSGKDEENVQKAVKMIREIIEDLPLNTPIEGKVSRVESYGVFVTLNGGGKVGLIHAKSLGITRGLEKIFKVGMPIKVVITEVDSQGRLVLKKV